MYWEDHDTYFGDDARALEWLRLDNQEAREQERRDRIRRDIGENYPKTCPDCGRKYWSAGAHFEECRGKAAA